VNITDKRGKILIALAEYCSVPALKNMSNMFVSSVIISAVSAQDALHDAANSFLLKPEFKPNTTSKKWPREIATEMIQKLAVKGP
jgi:hypothetical protein